MVFALVTFSCRKGSTDKPQGCDIQQAYISNAAKVTINTGVWGTISSIEGNCMPVVPPTPTNCTHCPVKRTIRIYAYTLYSQATPSGNSTIFFDQFSTPLIAETTTDAEGFFQVTLPPGNYSIAVIENGKLYANESDGWGGLQPFSIASGRTHKNVAMTYKAVF